MSAPKTGVTWRVDLSREDGNAFVIMGTVSRLIRDFFKDDPALGRQMAEEYRERAMEGDYEHLMEVTREYVDIQDTREATFLPYQGDERHEWQDELA